MNKLFLTNKGISDLLYADQTAQLELVGVGVETFIRNESKFSNTECIFRIHQSGVYHVYPFMTKRVVKVDNDLFKSFITKGKFQVEDLPLDVKS